MAALQRGESKRGGERGGGGVKQGRGKVVRPLFRPLLRESELGPTVSAHAHARGCGSKEGRLAVHTGRKKTLIMASDNNGSAHTHTHTYSTYLNEP